MSVSIQNAISLGIGADTAEVHRQINAMNQVIKSVTRPVQDLDKQMKLLNMSFDEGDVQVESYVNAMAKLQAKMDKAKASLATSGMKAKHEADAAWQAEWDRIGKLNEARRLEQRASNQSTRTTRQSANQSWMDEWDRVGKVQEADARRREAEALARRQQQRDAGLSTRSTRQAANQSWMDEWDRVGAMNAAAEAQRAEARSARRALLNRGDQYMSRFDTPSMSGRRDMREAYGQFREGAIGAEQYARAIKAIRTEHSAMGQSIGAVRSSMVAMVGPVVLAYKAFETLGTSIKLTAQLEEARAKFKVFTGSIEEANKVLAELRQFSKQSPVSFTTGQDAVSTMVQLGIDTKKAIPMFKAMAEITGGNSERLQALAYAYAQVGQAGRLMGQEHIQMVNAGFSPLRQMAKSTGQSFEELRKAMYEGKVTFDDVTKSMIDAAGPGGDYHGLMSAIAETMSGKLTRAQSGAQEAMIALGDAISPLVNSALTTFTSQIGDLTDALSALGIITKGVSNAGSNPIFDALRNTVFNTPISMGMNGVDGIKAMYQAATDQREELVATLSRLEQRTGGASTRMLSEENQARLKEAQTILGNIDAVIAKAKAGNQQLTELEKEYMDRHLAKNPDALKAVDPAELAKKRANDAFLEENAKLREKLAELRMGEDAHKRVSAAIGSMAGDQQKQLRSMLDGGKGESSIMRTIFGMEHSDQAIAAYNEMKQLQDDILATEEKRNKVKEQSKKLDQEANRAMTDLQAKAAKAMAGPRAEFVKAIAEIEAMKSRGMIDNATANKERERLGNEALKDQRASSLAPSLTVGSQDAYKALVSASAAALDKQTLAQERQTMIAEEQVRIMRELKGLNERLVKAAESEASM